MSLTGSLLNSVETKYSPSCVTGNVAVFTVPPSLLMATRSPLATSWPLDRLVGLDRDGDLRAFDGADIAAGILDVAARAASNPG